VKSTKLDKNQLAAISHGKGPLLIIAGAGTGKTTVITNRIKHLIIDKHVPPSQILALTFTEKAAFEMQERVDVLLPFGYANLWISTFHGFCDRILRDEAHFVGLDPNYKLISESESILFLKTHIFDLKLKHFKPMGNPTKFLDALLVHFSRLKDEDITPDEYIRFAQKKEIIDPELDASSVLELANAYKIYEELKTRASVMDFSDLISNTLLLFRTRKNILSKYQKQFQYILVDEFQDTNYAQNELAILLTNTYKNINVVADDDQSIYRFRGAAVSNVLQFKKNFPSAKIITLINNYRSTQTILDASYEMIQQNNPNRLEIVEHINKKLISKSKLRGKPIKLIHETRAEDEADAIAKEIKTISKKYDYKDIAILLRANNHSQGITAALQRSRIPYQFLGPGYLFQQEEIKDLIAYLTLLTDLSNSVALFRVLSMDIFNIPYVELNYFLNFAKKQNLSLFEALEQTNQSFLKEATQKKLENFRKMVIRHLEKSKKEQAGQILYYFLIDSKLFQTLNEINSIKDEKRVQNIAKFFDRIKNFETERTDSNIFTLVEWLTLMLSMGDSPTAADIDIHDQNAVNILTVHSSKGLEFKVVFLVNLVSDRFPTRERSEKIPLPQDLIKEKIGKDTDIHTQEERRLFYVGMTRAKELLYFTFADYYGTGRRIKKPSPFIYEALPTLQKMEQSIKPSNKTSLSNTLSEYTEGNGNADEVKSSKSALKITYTNYSNLQMFDICPLHYKAKAILNIPTPKSPVQSFGISMHNTLYDFYKMVLDGQTPTLVEFKNMLKSEWISEGYENKKHEKERYTQALKILKNFYKTECHPPVKPLGIELKFSFVLKNGVKVSGKIDRVDQKTDGGIKIIDYKTGEDNPKASRAHELQLAIYALAATKIKDEIFNHKPEEITLTLHFLEGNTKKSMSFTKADLEKFEEELIEKIKEIENSDFKCSGNVLCLNCEYRILCDSQR
jgi:DNA helicase II / ATP-dependent DNA helicase PcrA